MPWTLEVVLLPQVEIGAETGGQDGETEAQTCVSQEIHMAAPLMCRIAWVASNVAAARQGGICPLVAAREPGMLQRAEQRSQAVRSALVAAHDTWDRRAVLVVDHKQDATAKLPGLASPWGLVNLLDHTEVVLVGPDLPGVQSHEGVDHADSGLMKSFPSCLGRVVRVPCLVPCAHDPLSPVPT